MSHSRTDPVHEIRRQLAAEIVRSLVPMAQHVVAPHYGIRQPRMSELNRGIVGRCTIEWLIRRIHCMGGTVCVTVTLGDAGRQWRVEALRRNRASRV